MNSLSNFTRFFFVCVTPQMVLDSTMTSTLHLTIWLRIFSEDVNKQMSLARD